MLWARKNEELVKVQFFYNTVRKYFVDIEAISTSLITMQREVLSFDWPNEISYNEWKDKFVSMEQMGEANEAKEDDEEEGTKVKVTLTVNNEDKENPRVKASLQIIRDESSLSNLMATYSEESE